MPATITKPGFRHGIEQIAFDISSKLDTLKIGGSTDDLALARYIGRNALVVEDVEVARVTALRLSEALDTYDREMNEIADELVRRIREFFDQGAQ